MQVWLETQPMGGAMYATRNVPLALNNQLAFMRTQRADGRLPGMVSSAHNTTATSALEEQHKPKPGNGSVVPFYTYPGSHG